MSMRSFCPPVWMRCVLLLLLFATTLLRADTNPPVIAPTELPKDAVRVEIIEGIPDQTSWNFTAAPPSERYTEPAFGFAAMPTRYSPRGVKVDRGHPFLFRAAANVKLPRGEHRLLLRSRTGSRLYLDGMLVLSTRFPNLTADGHEDVPELPVAAAPDIRYLRPGHFESVTNFTADGRSHLVILEALIGTKGRRPELGELSVSVSSGEGQSFTLLSPTVKVPLTEPGWDSYEASRRDHFKTEDKKRRELAAAGEAGYWSWRHDLARKLAGTDGRKLASRPAARQSKRAKPSPAISDIDEFSGRKLTAAKVSPAPVTDDYSFLRRVTLDTIGIIPTPEQIDVFLHDNPQNRRANAIDRLLRHPGWADHWVSYWQDVLAENPGILKPMLNNTGPFRWWIHDSFADNKPMDRFATELILMEGSAYYGGPAGFGMASENDVPMAQKAQIIAQAFLGMQMQCARCHDAPYHDFKQKDLFSLAAMLRREPQPVPLSSSIPTNANIVIGRVVNVTLQPGSKVEPAWPFHDLMTNDIPEGVLRNANDSREKLAALVTDPRNERFAKVIVNRLWKRYLGWGIVEPVDDWETARPSHPELLDHLARELVTHDYDLKHVARLVLNSQTYQREVRSTAALNVVAGVSPAVEPGVPPGGKGGRGLSGVEGSRPGPGGKMPPSTAGGTPAATVSGVPPGGKGARGLSGVEGSRPGPGGRMPSSTAGETPAATDPSELNIETANDKPETRLFASPARRRMTAEQVVDSLFAAAGKPLNSEEMNLDVDGRRPVKDFNNLGRPAHGWEFASLSNERDRPALAMPKAQPIVDTLTTFGWREARQSPQTVRDHAANVLQPAALANGLLGNGRITRLSDDSAITALVLEDRSLPDLIRAIFLRVLSRPPTGTELKAFSGVLSDGYAERRLKPSGSQAHHTGAPARAVSWANHLNPEATKIKQELERQARAGDPPTERLRADWRERMEDALWSLVNSPEFIFVP